MSLSIASGLRELGHTEFAVLGTKIVGIKNPPPMSEILAAADVREARITTALDEAEALRQSRDAALEALLAREAQKADAPQNVKDYVSRRRP